MTNQRGTPEPEDEQQPQAELESDVVGGAELATAEDVAENGKVKIQTLPVLPLRGSCLLPLAVVPITVGRERSLQLVDNAMKGRRRIAVVMQKDAGDELASPENVHEIGTLATIHQMQRMRGDVVNLVIQGLERVRIVEFTQEKPYLEARVEEIDEPEDESIQAEAATRSVRDLFRRLVAVVPELPDILVDALETLDDPNQLAYVVAATAPFDPVERQEILELGTIRERMLRLIELSQHELSVRELGKQIASEAEAKMSKAQREYHLREQLRAIRRELGEDEGDANEDLRERLDKAALPDEARNEADRELRRLERIPSASPEHGMVRTYLEWMADLPWSVTSGGEIDVNRAARILDEDHYDLEKVKDRILEYLSVRKLRRDRGLDGLERGQHEPILCFVGPPGVGKTSLGQSVARALDREFARISLGGVHEEPEIRGHRRTYIGALPGRIIQALKRCGTADPIFMLDEVDKLGRGMHGDPAAALLEVLDPAQNNTFVDHYLGVGFDLSRVLFICTANDASTIPGPLMDRMETLQLAGYTEEEKAQIARRYLVDKQTAANAITNEEFTLHDDALKKLIRDYTREAGVRGLDRIIAKVCRKSARRIAEGVAERIEVNIDMLIELLGKPRRPPGMAERIDRPGVATGLAWTPMGGELLYVEAALIPGGKGGLTLTGSLGDVMRESAITAVSLVRSRADTLGVDASAFEAHDVHIHVPSGAIPKDGPSAGITMVTALASALANRPACSDIAMTGEVTLRGKVMPVGGVKEKVLAAHRAGVRHVVLPRWNMIDVEEVPEELREEMTFTPVDAIEDVVGVTLNRR